MRTRNLTRSAPATKAHALVPEGPSATQGPVPARNHTARRGAALMFVVGILALVAVILLVFASTGIGDARTASNAGVRRDADGGTAAVASYLQAVVADSVFSTTRQRQVLTNNLPAEAIKLRGSADPKFRRDRVENLAEMTDKVFRRTWTLPGVDPELISINQYSTPHRQFNPIGSVSTPWTILPIDPNSDQPQISPQLAYDPNTGRPLYFGERISEASTVPTHVAIDPRFGSDPWLSSSEPTRLNRSKRLGALGGPGYGQEFSLRSTPVDDIRDRFMDCTDLLNISNFAPDGRAINLANLRGNFDAASNLTGMSANLTLLTDRDVTSGLADEAITGPSLNSRLMRSRLDTDGIFSTLRLPMFGSNGDNNSAITATAFQLGSQRISGIDVADPNRPAHWFTNQIGIYRPVGDNRFPPGDPRNLDNQFRDTDGDGFYDSRLFELVDSSQTAQSDPATGIPFSPRPLISPVANMRLFVAARAIDLSGLVNVNTALSFEQSPTASSPMLNMTNFKAAANTNLPPNPLSTVWAMAGATPADIDLQRLLAMRGVTDGRGERNTNREYLSYGMWGQPSAVNFGLPSFYEGYESRITGVTPDPRRRLSDEIGGSAFTALVYARLYGDRPALGQTFKPTIDNTRINFAMTNGNSGIVPLSAPGAVGSARYGAIFNNPAYGTAVDAPLGARERQRMFYLTRPNQSMGFNFRGDVADSTGVATDSVLSLAGKFGIADEIELRSFQGLNRTSVTTSLESTVDGRSASTATTNPAANPGGKGPFRSNRPLSLEMSGNYSTVSDRNLVSAPFDATRADDVARADWATGLLRNQTSVRNYVTTISASRPLITDPSRPLLTVRADQTTVLPPSSNAQTGNAWPAVTLNDAAIARRNLDAAVNKPLDTADLPTAIEPILAAMERMPLRVRSNKVDANINGDYWKIATPYVSTTPVDRIPAANFEQSVAVAQLFRGYLDSLAPDLAGHPHLWEGGRDESVQDTFGLRARTSSLSYGSRSIAETRSNLNPSGSELGTLAAAQARDSFFDSRGTDYDLNLSELKVASIARGTNVPPVNWKPQLSLPWLGNTAELATRVSAHLTANFLDMNDVSDRPSAFTIVFDPAMKDLAAGGFATGTRVQNYGLFNANPPTVETSRSFGIEQAARVFIPSAVGYMLPPIGSRAFDAWVRAGNVGAVAGRDAELDRNQPTALTSVNPLLGQLPDYRIRGMLDVDYEIPGDRRTGQTGELPSRMPREYRVGAAPLDALKPVSKFVGPNRTTELIRTSPLQGQSTPPLMNIIGIKPQPFITAAMSLVMYADAQNQEITKPVTGNNQTQPVVLRVPMINGEKAFYNRDFLGEVVAFQLHNPFDRPLSLTLGSPIADRALDPNTGRVPAAADADAALIRWRKIHGGETISQADNTPLLPAQFSAIQYYLEFAGRYYAAAELVQDKQTATPQVFSVTMQPGETRFFYALARDPEFFIKRWQDTTRAFGQSGSGSSVTDADIDLFYHWINRQLAVENTVTERDPNTRLLSTKRAFLAPIRLMPVDPTNMTPIATPADSSRSTHPSREVLTALPQNIVRAGEPDSNVEVELAWGQNLLDPLTGSVMGKKNASDTEVRLWRNIRDELEPDGPTTALRADALLNDMLVDRLRQPKNSTAVGSGSDTDAFPFFKRTTTVSNEERDFPRLNIGFEPRKAIEGRTAAAAMAPAMPLIGMPTFALANPGSSAAVSGLGLLGTGVSKATASLTAPWSIEMASRVSMAVPGSSPSPGTDEFASEDPLNQQKFRNARGNGYSTVLYAAILRPGMKYDFPRAYKPNIEDSDDVALPGGVLPPWLMEAKAGVLSHNDVFDTFDRLELRTRQNTRDAFIPATQYESRETWIPQQFTAEQGGSISFYFDRFPKPTDKKPANAASYKFQISMFLDRAIERGSGSASIPAVMKVRPLAVNDLTPRKTVANEYVESLFTPQLLTTSVIDEKIARVLTYRHYTKPYIGGDQFSMMIRLGAGLDQIDAPDPLMPKITPAILAEDFTFTKAERPTNPYRPSQWTIDSFPRNVPPQPRVVPLPVMNTDEGEPVDYEMYKYVGAFGRDLLYQPAKRARNPIDPPELSTYPDAIRFSRNDWPTLPVTFPVPVMAGRPAPFGLTPSPAWQLANNGKYKSINQQGNFTAATELPDSARGVDQTQFDNFARDNRSAPNLSGLYYRAIVDQLPASLKIAHKPIAESIDAGEPNPPVRLTDLLLAWAVGPYEIPLRWKERNHDERKRQVGRPFEIVPVTNLDERYTTLSEAIALALDYDAPINYDPTLYTGDLVGRFNPAAALLPVFDRKDAMFRIGQMVSTAPQDVSQTAEINNPNSRDLRSSDIANLRALSPSDDPRISLTTPTATVTAASRYYPIRGVVLDAGRLSLTTSTPFSDIDGSTRFELVRDGPTAQHGSGIPLALNILNRFRVTNEGGVAEPLIGRVNLNTAPKAVLSVLPLLRPDPLLVSPPLPREFDGTSVGTTAGWGNVDTQPPSTDAAIRDVRTLLFSPKTTQSRALVANRGPSQSQMRERFLTQLTDRPTRTDFDTSEPVNPSPTNPSRPPAFRDMRIDDVAATLLSYRDKVPQFVLPRFANANDNALTNASVRIDFGDANFAAVDRSQFGGLYDAKGRRLASGILPLREGRGFQSFGELIAARFAEQAPIAMSKAEGNERGFLDPPLFPLPGTAPLLFNSRDFAASFNRRNLTLSSTVQLDRVALRSAGLDKYARQERALRHSGLLTEVNRDTDERDPNPYLPVSPERDLFATGLQYRDPNSGNVRTQPAVDLPVPTEIAQLLPPKSAANYESRLAILAALAETTTLRSDTFCVWFTVEGYTRDDVAGLTGGYVTYPGIPSPGTTAGFDVPAIAKPMSPTLRRRFVMILDRSNVVRPGDKPKVLSLQEVPFDAKSVPE